MRPLTDKQPSKFDTLPVTCTYTPADTDHHPRQPPTPHPLSERLLNTFFQILCIHLLHEASKGPTSLRGPYIQQLPRTYTTLCTWGTAAVEALQLQHATATAAEAVARARSDWTSARPVLLQLGKLPLCSHLAVCAASTRFTLTRLITCLGEDHLHRYNPTLSQR